MMRTGEACALQAALEGLTNWADLWGMSFNVQKCKVMHVGHANPGHDYNMSNVNLATTKEESSRSDHVQESKTRPTVCKGGKDSTDGTGTT